MTKTLVWQFIFKTAVFRNISDVTVENIWHHVEDIGLAFFHTAVRDIFNSNLWLALQDLTLLLSRARIFSSSRENPSFKAC